MTVPNETVTFYSGNPLDRLGYLRDDADLLKAALESPSTRFLLLNNLDPILDGDKFAYYSYDQIAPHLNSVHPLLLGVDREDAGFEHPRVSGRPYWAVDVTELNLGKGTNVRMKKISRFEGAIYAQARHMLDWQKRNRFCASCGGRTHPEHAGYQLRCDTEGCDTKKGVSNITFPRTDASIIVAVLDHKGQNVLVGRGKRFPPNMYSCLAGFLEPGESIEDCVRREVWEEAGVKVGQVQIHSSQPWPFPANIMLGCVAQVADASEESHRIFLGNDPELADAQWIPLQRMQRLCAFEDDGEIFVPPKVSIAWVLLDYVSRVKGGRL